jgi:hypothetical protein
MSADRIPASRGIAPLGDVPDGECRDGGPEPVIRGEHPVVAMPVLPRRGHEVSEQVEELEALLAYVNSTPAFQVRVDAFFAVLASLPVLGLFCVGAVLAGSTARTEMPEQK